MMTAAQRARLHECPGLCGRLVGVKVFACPEDWQRLPKQHRDAILATWAERQADESKWRAHGEAMAAASRWYREQAKAIEAAASIVTSSVAATSDADDARVVAPTLGSVVRLVETGTIYTVSGLETAGLEATVYLVEIGEWNRRRRAAGLPEVNV